MPRSVENQSRATALFDEQHDQRLADLCAPVLTLILQLRSAIDFGEPSTLRQRVKDLLSDVERAARQTGIAHEELRQAKFAMVAFLDETILSSDWPYRDQWVAQPLQLELYDRYDAGEVFFTRLEDMLKEPVRHSESLEVYYLCMALGFKGQYQLHDQGRLQMLTDDTFQALQKVPGYSMNSERLSPNGEPQGQLQAEARQRVPPWMVVVLAAVLGMLIYGGMYFYASSASDDAATRIESVRASQNADG